MAWSIQYSGTIQVNNILHSRYYTHRSGSKAIIQLVTLGQTVCTSNLHLPLYGFCISATLAVSAMGGVFAILPTYEADLFGAKFVGAIHGRMLLFSSAAALAGERPYMYS